MYTILIKSLFDTRKFTHLNLDPSNQTGVYVWKVWFIQWIHLAKKKGENGFLSFFLSLFIFIVIIIIIIF